MSTTTMSTTTTAPAPAFWTRLLGLFADTVAHAYLLNGNVYDYTANPAIGNPANRYMPVDRFLEAQLLGRFDILVTVHPSRGLDFPNPEHRGLFLDVLGLGGTLPQGTQVSPLLAALRAEEAAYRAAMQARQTPPRPVRGAANFAEVVAMLDALLTVPRPIPARTDSTGREIPAPVDDEGHPRAVRCGVILYEAELMLPPCDLGTADAATRATLARLLNWGRSPAMVDRQHLICMVAESLAGLHAEIRRSSSRWEPIEIARPNEGERLDFIESRLELYEDLHLAESLTPRMVARLTGGLTLRDVEDILFRGLGAGALTKPAILERKADVMRHEFQDAIQMDEPRFGLARVGGYEEAKDFFRRRVLAPMNEGRRFASRILLPGPPGTGKSQLCEALAGEAGMQIIRWAPNKIMGKFVGDTERGFERTTRAIMANAPCIVQVDELDEQFRDRARTASGGSQADDRMHGMFLSWLEDPDVREKVVVIATTNHPEHLDAAIRDRFTRVVPILPPTREERPAVLAALALAYLDLDLDNLMAPELRGLIDATEGWTGRHMRGLVEMAAELRDDGANPLQALADSIAYYRAPDIGKTGEFIALALDACTDLSLVPDFYRKRTTAAAPVLAEAMNNDGRRRRRDV